MEAGAAGRTGRSPRTGHWSVAAAMLAAVACAMSASAAVGVVPLTSATPSGIAAVPLRGTEWAPPVDGAHPGAVIRAFDPPPMPWSAGHRGVDLVAPDGQVVAPGAGTIRFVGPVAGRGVVTIAHPDGLLSSLEPVVSELAVGDRVAAGQSVGTVEPGAGHCPDGCVHWGVRVPDGWAVGGTVRDRYLDPLLLLGWSGPSVLWPLSDDPRP